MTDFPRKIAVFGSTGSIGHSALEVARHSGGTLQITAISAHHCLQEMVSQAQELLPRYVVATDEEAASQFDWSALPRQTRLLVGQAGLEEVVRLPEVEIVVAAIVGGAGLTGAWAAVEAGKTVALANHPIPDDLWPKLLALRPRAWLD